MIRLRRPFNRSLAALMSGLLLWLALPGEGNLWFLLFVGMIPLFAAVYFASGKKQAALYGLLFGVMHFLCLLYWVVIVLGKYGGLPPALSLSALFLFALANGCYNCLWAGFSYTLFHSFRPRVWVWMIPALWVGVDWLKGQLFTGFPWMDLGYGMWSVPEAIQIADVFGHYGVTFYLVLINAFLFFLLIRKEQPERILPVALPVFLVCNMIIGYSLISWHTKELRNSSAPVQTVGVVQGNIDQSLKWSPQKKQETVDIYVKLSEKLIQAGGPALIVWPETALPFYINDQELFGPVYTLLTEKDATVLTGVPWYEIRSRQPLVVEYYNSAIILDQNSTLVGRYSKSHLVPFGEYVPLKRFLPFIEPLVETVGNFSPGKVEEPLSYNELHTGVLICYESIFPAIARKWSENGANLLVNLTNDAWYGKSSAPYQSLSMAVFRAVENERSLVRSANTGVSAFVNPLGRVKKQSKLFVSWAENDKVTLHSHLTWYVQGGYSFAPLCLAAAVTPLFALFRRRRKVSLDNSEDDLSREGI